MRSLKIIAAIWVFVASSAFVSTVWMPEAKAQFHASPLSLGSLSQELQTPEDIARYMWKHFAFEDDQRVFGREEYWQSPEEFIENRKGDCEDFAQFAVQMLKLSGKKAFLLNVYGSRYAHTVCVYEENGKYNVIDGTDVRRFEAGSLEELASAIHPEWDRGAIVTARKQTASGRILKSFERQARIQARLAASL